MSAVAILGTAGYALAKSSPYNNENITFINRDLNDFSKEMKNFINKDFNNFNRLMNDLQNGNYDDVTHTEIYDLDRYIDTILTCNFKGYHDASWYYRDREQSGFVIEFEKYFPSGSEERKLIEIFSGYYERGVSDGYRYINPDMNKIIKNCTNDYHTYGFQISQLPVLPRYIILKIVRPMIAANESQYAPYYKRDSVLSEIDREIEKCMNIMQKQCAKPEVNYNVSRR